MQLLTQTSELGLLVIVRYFELLQLADLRLEHGRFDLGLLQRLVIGRLGGRPRRGALCGGQRLFGFVQLLTQTSELGLLVIVRYFELLQLADLRLEHGGFDLGLLQRLVVCWLGGRRGAGALLDGGIERLLRRFGGFAQIGDLGLQFGRVVRGELLFGFLQRDLGHAGVDLQLLLSFREPRLGRCARGCSGGIRGHLRAFALRRLGTCGAFGAGLALGFLLFLGTAQTLLAQFEALLGVLGLLLLLLQLADLALGGAVVLHQRDARWADVGAGAAFDTVEQVMRLELFVFLAESEEVQLLWQQADRTDFGAFTTANTGQRWWWRRQFFKRAGQQAVGGLDHRYLKGRQGEAHHRAAHDQTVEPILLEPGERQQFTDRRADQYLDVHRPRQCFASEGGDARDQRLAEQHGVMDGNAGADVLAEHADIRRQTTAGHLFASEDLDQLLFAAGGVLGRKDLEHEGALTDGRAHRGDGFGLVVLDADQHVLRLDQVREDFDTRHQFGGFLAHQQIVGGDVRLALGTVDDQRADALCRWRGQLDCRRKACTAEAADTSLTNQLEQRRTLQRTIIEVGLELDPAVLAIAIDDDRIGEHA